MSTTEMEKRLAEVERKLNRLTQKIGDANSLDINGWMDEIHGTFKNDATYRQATRLGREWRKSQRPKTATKSKRPTK